MLTQTKITVTELFENKPDVTLTSYIAGTSAELPFNEKRKAILVIPGGAYAFCSDREADPITRLPRGGLQHVRSPLFRIPHGQSRMAESPYRRFRRNEIYP